MTSKQRVHAALRREPVDRVPVYMWFHPGTAKRLGVELDLPAAAVATAMGNDICQAWVGNNHGMEGIVHARDGESHVDDWGVEWVRLEGFNQIRRYPLRGASDDALRTYRFPERRVEALLANMTAAMAQAETMFVGCDISPCVFELATRLRGMEQALLDLAEPTPATSRLLQRCGRFSLHLAEAACARFQLDWLWTGDDVAGQSGMFMSPATWRAQVQPHLQPIFAAGKARGLWVAYHSCGGLRPIIGDLIDMGMDVLNPIQCNCPDMDPLALKAEFGERLAFMGGVDTQHLLPQGTAAEVRRATERLLTGMTAHGGGYILAASHTVPPETPLANIFAMYEVAGISRTEINDRAADMRRAAKANGA